MKRYLLLTLLATLAACSQAPITPSVSSPELSTQTFGTSADDYANAVAAYGSGAGVYAVGQTQGSLHTTKKGYIDAVVRKYSASGSLLWGRQFGKAGGIMSAVDVVTDGSNNAFVLTKGAFNSFKPCSLHKISPSGSKVWSKAFCKEPEDYYDPSDPTSMHGSIDQPLKMARSGNNLYILGVENIYWDDGEDSIFFVIKMTTSGSILWRKDIYQAGAGNDYVIHGDIAVDSSGNAYAVCSSGYEEPSLRKITPSGSVLWTKSLGNIEEDYPVGVSVYGNNVYVAYAFEFESIPQDIDVQVSQLSTAGVLGWTRTFGGTSNETVHAISATSQGIFVGGQTKGYMYASAKGASDAFLTKLNFGGGTLWGAQFGSTGQDDVNEVVNVGAAIYSAGQSATQFSGSTPIWDGVVRKSNASNGSLIWNN